MAVKKEEEFNYSKWLKDLKPGDRIKIADCYHSRTCECETLAVDSLVPVFDKVAIVVKKGCTVKYYDKDNGRELGGRKGTYKDGSIGPFTKKDQEDMDKRKSREQEESDKVRISVLLSGAITGRGSAIDHTLRQVMTKAEMEAVLKKLTK